MALDFVTHLFKLLNYCGIILLVLVCVRVLCCALNCFFVFNLCLGVQRFWVASLSTLRYDVMSFLWISLSDL